MHYFKNCVIVFLVVLAAASCNKSYSNDFEDETDISVRAGFLPLQHHTFSWNTGGVSVTIDYDLVSRPLQTVDDSVNAFVLTFLQKALGAATAPGDAYGIEELARDFAARCEAIRSSDTLHAAGWDYRISCTIRQPYPGVVSVECSEGGYTGGAHPEFAKLYRSYYSHDAQPMTVKSLFPSVERFNAFAEKIFRKTRRIPSGALLDAAGYRFDNQRFSTGDHFVFTNDSIVFLFPSFDRKPHMMGSSELKLAVSDVRGLLEHSF